MKPTIYTVATTHLDTSWSWTLETTIGEYLPKTVRDNAELFKKYPGYRFSFEGSYRYELLEEYYPELFEQVKGYIADGCWAVAGSSFENGTDSVILPEDESIIILAATATLNENKCETAFPMFDELEKREFDFRLNDEDERRAHNAKKEGILGRCKFVRNYAVRRLKTELKQRFG